MRMYPRNNRLDIIDERHMFASFRFPLFVFRFSFLVFRFSFLAFRFSFFVFRVYFTLFMRLFIYVFPCELCVTENSEMAVLAIFVW